MVDLRDKFYEDQAAIDRRRAIAQMLMEQGNKPLETNQVAGGYVVPVSPLSAINKVAQQLSGAYIGRKADDRGRELKRQLRNEQSKMVADYVSQAKPDRSKAISLVTDSMVPDELKAVAMQDLRAQLNAPKGTPGTNFIPSGAVPETFGGAEGFRLPSGDFIVNRTAMTDYQQAMTDPARRGAIQAALEARKGVKATDEQGREFFAPQGSLNPDFTNTIPNLISVESSNNPNAVSNVGAQGLSQIMPKTAANPGYGVEPINTKSVRDQVRGGADYLLGLMDHYVKSGANEADAYKLALAAYNEGPGNVDRNGPSDAGIRYANKVMGQSPAEAARAKAEAVIEPEMAKKKAEAQVTAQLDLPKIEQNANYAKTLIDELSAHPGMSDVVGVPSPMKYIPGTPAQNFNAKLDQLKGKNFLEAFQALKGGGQITEIEGKKATDAIAALNTAQSEVDFKKELDKLKSVIDAGYGRASALAGNNRRSGQAQPSSNEPTVEELLRKYSQ